MRRREGRARAPRAEAHASHLSSSRRGARPREDRGRGRRRRRGPARSPELSYAFCMVARPKDRPATYRDIEALPRNMVGEIIRGVLYANPRPAAAHARAATTIGEELGPPFNRGKGGPGGW